MRNIVRASKTEYISSAIFSFYCAVCIYAGRHLWQEIPFDPSWQERILRIVVLTLMLFVMTLSLYRLYRHHRNRVSESFTEENQAHPILYGIICWAALIILWLPALLSNFPGILTWGDAAAQWGMVQRDTGWSAHHPILHSVLILLCQKISIVIKGELYPRIAVFCYSVIQLMLMAAAVVFAVCFIRHSSKRLAAGAVLWYALFPMFALYSIYMTKDVLYTCALAAMTIAVVQYITVCKNTHLCTGRKVWNIIAISILALLSMMLRSNGRYVVITYIVIVLVVSRRKEILAVLAVCVLCSVLQKPIFDRLGIAPTEIEESLGLPINQIANTIVHDRDFSEEELELISAVMPIEQIRENYWKLYSDPIKFSSDFHRDPIQQNKRIYAKLYLRLGLRYPKDYAEAAMNLTIGYWYPGVDKGMLSTDSDLMEIALERIGTRMTPYLHTDYYRQLIDGAGRKSLLTSWMFSIGLQVMIMWGCLNFFLMDHRYSEALLCLPSILNWLTVLIAAPSYGETRYVFITFFMNPVLLTTLWAGHMGVRALPAREMK
jgi:hypothetical protein